MYIYIYTTVSKRQTADIKSFTEFYFVEGAEKRNKPDDDDDYYGYSGMTS